jgi:hypothetical protein
MGENLVGQITAKYDPKKPGDNYTVYLSGKDGNDYRVYLPKCEYGKEDIVQILAATAKTSSKGSVYYQANNISLVNEEPQTNGHTEPTRETVPQNINNADKRAEDMLETGIWTRSAPAVVKTMKDVEEYCDRAFAYRRKRLKGDDEPFKDQF